MALDKDGKCRGFAFIEYADEVGSTYPEFELNLIYSQKAALAALAANNHELKSRRMAVTLSDSRFKSRNRYDFAPVTVHSTHFSRPFIARMA
jgi:squamous cell carcinoma antigen recognized by T-cells 3